jgi:putative ABC transport system permease protein
LSGLRGFGALARALVIRPLVREKLRSVLTILGIAVGVAVLVAIQLSNASALRAFSESVDAISGRANFIVTSDVGFVDERVLLDLQPLWAEGARLAPVLDIDGSIEPEQLPFRLLAVDLLSDLHFRDYRFAKIETRSREQSDGPEARQLERSLALFEPDSIVLPEVFARERGLDIGSPLVVTMNGRTVTCTVRGILQPEGPATAFNGSLGVMDIAAAQQAFGLEGKLTRIDLMLEESLAGRVPALVRDARPPVRLERPSRRNERVGKMLRAFRINLFALAGVALLVGVFLVYNTVLISILRRRGDVGVFKTLGASPGQIFAAFVAEGAVFGFIGSLLGIALGYALAWGTLDLIARTIDALYVATSPQTITLTPAVVAVAIALGTIVSVLSSVQPALEASAVRPSTMIRAGIYQRIPERRARRLAMGGILLLLLSAAVSQVPPIGGVAVAGYIAVVIAVAGFAALSPLSILVASRALRNLLQRAFGVPGTLASVSLPVSLRRVAVAGAALSMAIGMMVAVSMMIGSFRETVQAWVGQTIRSDLWIRPSQTISNSPTGVFPAAITEDLEKIDFIAQYDRIRMRDALYRDDIILVGGGDFDRVADIADMPMVRPRRHSDAIREALRLNGVMISESLSIKHRLKVGDRFELATAAGVQSWPITGIYRDYSNDRGVAVMNRDEFIRAFDDDTINTIALFLKPGVDPEFARRELERRLGAKYRVFAFTNATIRTEVMRIFDQTFLITYALLVVSLAVAVLGIINTLSALILERSREIALLRVLGTSREQIRLMILLESAILGIVSTTVGLISGYVLSYILIFVINKQSFGWTIQFDPPLALVAGSLAITFAATVIAGLYPARLANSIAMATALKSE